MGDKDKEKNSRIVIKETDMSDDLLKTAVHIASNAV
jgi:hypothetical protein